MAVTRCQENTGFLVLHRCENVAEFQCAHCGRKICREHGSPVEAGAAPRASVAPAMPAVDGALMPPPPPPGTGHAYACQTCLRRSDTRAQSTAADDPYYSYPYYGSYRPYHSHYYYDHADRGVFSRDQDATPESADGLGS